MGKLNIISRSSEPFLNRTQAAELLAQKLEKLTDKNTVILGIPRGGIVIAKNIAKKLSVDFDIVLSRKIGAPFNPEFAIGAVSEDGRVFFNKAVLYDIDIKQDYIKKAAQYELEEIKRRAALYRKVKPKLVLEGKTVIISDDGVATGVTMQATIWAVRQEKPNKVIIALPVGPYDVIVKLANESDEILCLRVPEFFSAVGQFYIDFPQIKDSQVLELLK